MYFSQRAIDSINKGFPVGLVCDSGRFGIGGGDFYIAAKVAVVDVKTQFEKSTGLTSVVRKPLKQKIADVLKIIARFASGQKSF